MAENLAKCVGATVLLVRRATPRSAEGYGKKCGGLRQEVRRATPRGAEGYAKKCGGLRLEVPYFQPFSAIFGKNDISHPKPLPRPKNAIWPYFRPFSAKLRFLFQN